MIPRFCPTLDALEARDVPAFASFMMPDTTIGSAFFSTPEGVDPAQASQVFSIDDLEVLKAGDRYSTPGGASAEYAYGVLVGLTTHAVGDYDEFDFSGSTVQVDEATAPLAFDGAATEITFDLPDRTTGALSFDISWDQVDPAQANQSLTPMAFSLNIAGHNISTDFTTAPTLIFEYGEFVGLNFAADTSALVGFPYTSITINGLNVTAIQAGTGLPMNALAQKTAGKPSGFINFAPLGTQANAYVLNVKFTTADGSTFEQAYNIGANTSAADVTALVMASIPQASVTPGTQGNPLPTTLGGTSN